MEFVDVDDSRFGQRRVQPDGVVTGRQQESIPLCPVRIVGTVSQLVGVDRCQHIGGAEGLADIALALGLAHVQHVVTHPVGGLRRPFGLRIDAASPCAGTVSDRSLVGELALARAPRLAGCQRGPQADCCIRAEQQGGADPAEALEQQRGDERSEAGHHRRNLICQRGSRGAGVGREQFGEPGALGTGQRVLADTRRRARRWR